MKGEFVLNPLPAARGRRHVYAQVERGRVWTEALTVDAAHPEQRITLTVPRLREVVIEVVDTDGKPVADIPLVLEFDRKLGAEFRRLGLWGRGDDGAGQGSPASRGSIRIWRTTGCILRRTVRGWVEQYRLTRTSPRRIVLKRGHVLAGRVLDEISGTVPGVTLGASCAGDTRPENTLYYFTAEDKTDDEGGSGFRDLPAVPMSLTAHGVQEPPLPFGGSGRRYMPDGDEVTIQGKVADWVRNRDR